MTNEQFQRLVIRALWAILFALLRHHANLTSSLLVEDIEKELRELKG